MTFAPSVHVDVQVNSLREFQFWLKREFSKLARKAGGDAAGPLMDAFHAEVMEMAQNSPPPPLAMYTIRDKKRRKLSEPNRSWFATGFTLKNLWREPYRVGGGHTYKLMPSRKWHKNEKGAHRKWMGKEITVEQILAWLEEGTDANPRKGRQPPRPVLEPATKKIAMGHSRHFRGATRKFGRAFAANLRQSLRENVGRG